MEIDVKPRASYASIDITKFILSLFVVALHCSPFPSGGLGTFVACYLFKMSVPLFFFYSSWLFFKSGDWGGGEKRKTKIVKFFKRIGVLYIIWTLIYSVDIYGELTELNLFSGNINDGYLVFIGNFLFTGAYSHLWYLLASLWGMAIILFLKKVRIKSCNIFLISLLFYAIGVVLSSYYGGLAGSIKNFADMYYSLFLSVRCGLLIGFPFMSLGLVMSNDVKFRNPKLLLGIFVVLRAAEVLFIKVYDLDYGMDLTITMMPLVALIAYNVIQMDVKANRCTLFLRYSSIVIYLVHMKFVNIAGFISENATIQYLFVIILSLGVAWIAYWLTNKKKWKFLKWVF